MRLPRTSGVQLHLTSLPGGKLRRTRAAVRRLARGGGPVLVAGAAARAAQSSGLSLQGIVGFRCMARVPGRSRRARVGGGARGVPRAPRVLDRRLGGLRRRHAGHQRPGPLRPRVVCTARVCPRVRRAPDRRRAHLRRARQRRPRPPSRALPRRRRGRRPARRLHGQGAALGNPIYDWGALRNRRYRWWVQRLRRTFQHFDLARIDHFRAFCASWAVPAGARDASGGRWARGPGRAVFDAAHAELAGSGDRRGPRRHHAGRHAPARRAGPAGHGRAAVRLQSARARERPPPRALPRRLGPLHGHHDNDTLRGWFQSLPPESVELVRARA